MNKDGILPTSEAITWETHQSEKERKKDEQALQRLQRLMAEMILKDPTKYEKFFPQEDNDD